MLMLMMMMSSQNNTSGIQLQIQSYDGQIRHLDFKNVKDLKTFLETDFEIVEINAPVDQLSTIRDLIKNQSVMDVDRNAIIKINKQIRESVDEKIPDNNTSDRNKAFDFNIHEKDIMRV